MNENVMHNVNVYMERNHTNAIMLWGHNRMGECAMGVVEHKYMGRNEIHTSESTAFRWDREIILLL